MKRNLTRETRRAGDSLTALCHLKEEMKSKHGDIVALKNEQIAQIFVNSAEYSRRLLE
jgi:hypothetical protein